MISSRVVFAFIAVLIISPLTGVSITEEKGGKALCNRARRGNLWLSIFEQVKSREDRERYPSSVSLNIEKLSVDCS
jgi:hypothetical protein